MAKIKQECRTVSHIIALTTLVLYVFAALFGAAVIAVVLIRGGEISTLLSVYVSLVSVSATGFFGFYERKSERENVQKIANAKNNTRLDMAQDIFELIRTNKLNSEAIELLKMLISDSDTAVSVGGFGGVSTIDETTYTAVVPHDMRGQ